MMDVFFEDDPHETFVSSQERYPNFSLEEYLKELAVPFKVHASDDHEEHAICCPECVNRGEERPDTKYRLWINNKEGKFTCYNCDWSGTLVSLVRSLSQVTVEKAIRILSGRSLDPMEHMNLKLVMEEQEDVSFGEDDVLKPVDLPYGFDPITGPHPYLEKRGIPWEYARDHEWGYCTVGFYANRIIVPTFMNSVLVYWQARATWEDDSKDFRKVLNPTQASSKPILYQYDDAKEFSHIIIVEGFTDAVKVGPDAVATNGKRLHGKQVEWLSKTKAQTVTLMWDEDAWKARKHKNGEIVQSPIMRAADLLKVRFHVRLARMPDANDAGSYPYKSPALRKIIEDATPA